MKRSLFIYLVILIFISKASAQSGLCDPTTPFFHVNLSGQPGGTWTSAPPVQRAGNCCGTNPPDKCIEFEILLDPTAVAINFNLASGAVPPGAMYYQIGCGPQVQVGQPICLNGPGPYTLTFCKPGNNLNTYAITSFPGPSVSPSDTASQGCSALASVNGLIVSSITWTSIAPGAIGQYNNFLSCNSACSSVNITPNGSAYPTYVDYKVCGTPAGNLCLGNSTFCDTVRIYFNPPLSNTINPNPAVYCSSASGINLTGNINGGVAPYSFNWVDSSGAVVGNGQSYYAASPGTYTFEVRDANYPVCPSNTKTITVTQEQLPIVNAGPDQTVCGSGTITLAGTIQNATTYTWVGGNGSFVPNRNTLNATYTPNSTEIANGSVTLSLTSSNINSCPTVSDQLTITIKPPLITNINGPNIICYGQATNLSTTTSGGSIPYTYLWNTGNTNSGITNITAGSYSVIVTDATPGIHCTASANINIIQNPQINIITNSDALTSCDLSVNISAGATGGSVGNYSYLWSTGETTPQISVYSGTYIITATDIQGCSAQSSVNVVAPNSTLTSAINGQSIICNNATTTLTAAGNGGAGNYTYSWSNGATSATINVSAGNYCVNVRASNGCISASCITVIQTTPVNVSIGTPPLICQGASTFITASSTGGTSPYSYLWNNGLASSTINQGLGNYSVTATDALGCIGSTSVSISEEPVIVLALNSQAPNCFGETNGSATVLVNGGITPYSYSWSYLGNTTSSISGIQAGSYTVTVTDALGCFKNSSVLVSQPAPLSVNNTVANVNCYGGNNGSSNTFVSGGTGPYQYSWTNGQSFSTASGLSAGNYSVTVLDANGCTKQNAITVTQTAQINSDIRVAAPVRCNGSANGSLGVSVAGGNPGYTYSWSTSPVQTSSTAVNLSAGSYTVIITDINNCVVSNSYTLTNPPLFNATIQSISNVSCFGGTDGSVSVFAIGGQGPYTYNWSNSGVGTATQSGFFAGNYTVQITDSLGCIIVIAFTIAQPANALTVNAGSSQIISCNTSTTLTALASGGTPGYSYSWNTGSTSSSIAVASSGNYTVTVTDFHNCTTVSSVNVSFLTSTISVDITSDAYVCVGQTTSLTANTLNGNGAITYNWNNGGNTPTINAGVGNYCVTATDQDGCSSTDCKNMRQAPALIVNDIYTKACPGGVATLNANAGGGIPPFTYLWSTGASTSSITGLTGTYSLTVTDSNGCWKSVNVTILPTTIMNVTANNLQNISCFNGSNGVISVSVNGGTSPYSFSWSPLSSNSNLVYNLIAGNYTVTVTDSLGCVANKNFALTQPTQALTLTPLLQNVSCYGGSDGSAAAVMGGGASPYSYLWANGDTINSLSNIAAGSYTVYATDNNGCLTFYDYSITQPVQLDLSLVQSTNALCNGAGNGTSTLTSAGGTRPISYSWSNGLTDSIAVNLTAGNYQVNISDNHNCKDSVQFNVSQPSTLSYSYTTTDALCTNDNGSITISNISGGAGGYTILWYDGTTGFTHNSLLPGTYAFTIKDINNCTLLDSLNVGLQSFDLNVVLTKTDVNCFGENTGSVAAAISNGVIPFVYNWSNGASSPGINGLFPGTYNVNVTDANGCTGTDSANVNLLHYVNLTVVQPTLVCYKDTMSITASGAVNYSWYNNSNILLTNNPALIFIPTVATSIYVIGYNDVCTDTFVVNISGLPKPNVFAGNDTFKCYGSFVQLNATGAVNYSWTPSTGLSSSNTANPVSVINTTLDYIVTGTDANGCRNSDTVNVSTYALPVIFLSYQDSICRGNSSVFNAGGGVNYNWSPGNSLTSTTGSSVVSGVLTNTTYNLQVISSNGCTSDTSFMLHILNAANVNITSASNTICLGDSLSLTASGGITYDWYPTTNIASTNSSNTQVYPTTSGYYYVTADLFYCPVTDSIFVSVNPLPNVNAGINDYDMCAQGNVQMSGTGSGTILWTPSTGLSNAGILNPVANPNVTTTYTLTITDAIGCSNSDNAIVNVNPIPVANFSVGPVCLGNTSVFNNLSTIISGNISSYFWDFGDTANSNSALFNAAHLYNTCGSFSTMLIVISNKNCANAIQKTLNVNCLPVVQYNISDSVLCEADKLIIQNYSTGASSYNWDFGDGNFSTASSPFHNYNNYGSYTITLTANNLNGCSNSLSKSVIIYDKPQAVFTPSSICADHLSAFIDNSTIADGFINQWLWSFGALGASNLQNPSVSFGTAGNYNVSLIIYSNYGCTDTANNTVSVDQKPQLTINAANICLGQTSSISAFETGLPAVTNWVWDLNGDGIFDANGSNQSYQFANIGEQLVTVIASGTNGCIDTSHSILKVFPVPRANFYSSELASCAPTCITIYDSSYVNPEMGSTIAEHIWQANGSFFSNSNDSAVFCSGEGGLYHIGLIIKSSDGCTSQANIKNDFIEIYPKPTADFSYSPKEFNILNSMIEFENLSTNANHFFWNFNDKDISTSQLINPSHQYSDTGYYCIELSAYNEYGCNDTTTKCITVSNGFTIYIPNAFTPDQDKLNEIFRPLGYGFYTNDSYDLLIFNRWGDLIFESRDYNIGWDGVPIQSHDDEIAQTDVYVYRLKVKEISNDKIHKYIGRVTLLK